MANRFNIGASVDLAMKTNRFTRGLDRSTRGLRRFHGQTRRTQSLTDRLGASLRRGLANAFTAATAAAAALGVAAVAALSDIIQVGAEFDRTMQGVASRFTEPIERGSEAFEMLERAAMDSAAASEFGAGQSASALQSLAQAGFDAQQAAAALRPTVDLATLAEVDLGDAASMAARSLGQWGLMAEDSAQLGANLARVNDVLARAATSADLSVTDLTDSFRDAAPTARAVGSSLEQTTAMLDALARDGISGAQAGTQLRNVFLQLSSPASTASRALRRLGIQTTDSEGNLRGMLDILQDVQDATGGMASGARTRALTNIFGRENQAAGGSLLGRIAEIRELTTTLEGAAGAAAAMAASARDSAAGDMDSLTSALEVMKLEAWALIRGPFRELTQGFTEWIRSHQGDITSAFDRIAGFVRENREELTIFAAIVGGALAALAAVAAGLMAGVVATLAFAPAVIALVGAAAMRAFEWFQDAIRPAAETLGRFIAGVRTGAEEIATAVREFVVGAFVLARRAVDPYLGPIVAFFRFAASTAREVWAPVGAFFGRLFGTMGTTASETWTAIATGAQTIAERIRAVFEPIREFFVDLWDSIAGGFMEALGWAVDGVGRIVSNVRAAGRDELDSDRPPPPFAPQLVDTNAERVSRSVSETINRDHMRIEVGAEPGARARVTRRPSLRGNATLATTGSAR